MTAKNTTKTPKKVEIYSTPTCHFCHMAKDFFDENNIKYTNYDVSTDLAKRREMMDKTGQMGVPVIVVDGDFLVGFDEDGLKSKLGL
jgi:glutaredoxin-like YruB-family protein